MQFLKNEKNISQVTAKDKKIFAMAHVAIIIL